MAILNRINWGKLDRLARSQQRSRERHSPAISLFRWWARRPHAVAGSILEAARAEFGVSEFLVADPFSGGGTVAFEAVRRHLRIYAQDLYPWPSQGLATALTYAPPDEFENAARTLLQSLDCLRTGYQTTSENHTCWETSHVIRVRTCICIFCSQRLFLYRDPLISLASRKASEAHGFFGCSACGAVNRRRKTIQSFKCGICGVHVKIKGPSEKGRRP